AVVRLRAVIMFTICSHFLRLSTRRSDLRSHPMPHAKLPARSASETEAADITARILLETECVLFRPDDPFTFTSGRLSPVYIDCRRLISFRSEERRVGKG